MGILEGQARVISRTNAYVQKCLRALIRIWGINDKGRTLPPGLPLAARASVLPRPWGRVHGGDLRRLCSLRTDATYKGLEA